MRKDHSTKGMPRAVKAGTIVQYGQNTPNVKRRLSFKQAWPRPSAAEEEEEHDEAQGAEAGAEAADEDMGGP